MAPIIRPHSARLLYRHRHLLWRVARTDLKARYAGSVLGIGWALLMPLLVLGTNAAVYSLILRVRAPGLTGIDYVFYIFAGTIPYLMTSESLQSGVSSIVTSKAVWSNTVFPVDLAPPKAVLLAQGPFIVGFAAMLLTLGVAGRLQWTAVLVPVLWLLQVLALVGLTWMLSLVNLVFRDLPNLISLLLMLVMIGSPIAYTPEMVPEKLRFILTINPLAYFVRAYQTSLVFGRWPDLLNAVVLVGLSLGLFVGGGYLFARNKAVMVDHA